MKTCHDPFLVIPGMIKSGTTSLAHYLASHPQICAPDPIEPYYFMPLDMPPRSTLRDRRDDLADFLATFRGYRPGQIRLDDSTGYVRAPETAVRIKEVLPNAKILIILRDPIARLQSYHDMATLFRWLPARQSFDEYVAEVQRLRDEGVEDASAHYIQAIGEGLYAETLPPWLEAFGHDNVLVICFEDMKSDPRRTLQQVAKFAGIDPGFYEDYEFVNVNPSRQVKSEKAHLWYLKIMRILTSPFPRNSRLRQALAGFWRRRIFPALYYWGTVPASKQKPAAETEAYLRDFYAQDMARLASLLKQPPPWLDKYQR